MLQGERSSMTGKTLGTDHCMYILGSVYTRMSSKCTAMGGTPDGLTCKYITVSSIPVGQECSEYVSNIYTEWPRGGTFSETVNGRISKCSFEFLSNLDRTGRTYVGEDIVGTCFENMVVTQPSGNCVCKENYGYISAYSCAPCDSDNRFIAGSCD